MLRRTGNARNWVDSVSAPKPLMKGPKGWKAEGHNQPVGSKVEFNLPNLQILSTKNP